MEEKFIDLSVSKDDLAIIFACLQGSYSCPPSRSDLINHIYALCRENNVSLSNVYCK